jgi:hypothetical protein
MMKFKARSFATLVLIAFTLSSCVVDPYRANLSHDLGPNFVPTLGCYTPIFQQPPACHPQVWLGYSAPGQGNFDVTPWRHRAIYHQDYASCEKRVTSRIGHYFTSRQPLKLCEPHAVIWHQKASHSHITPTFRSYGRTRNDCNLPPPHSPFFP